MRPFWLCVCLAGCNVYQDLLTPRTEPGGAIKATIGASPERMSKGMGEDKKEKERLEVSGFSPELTFGLIAGEDASGRSAKAVLVNAEAAIELPLTPTSSTRLQIHLDGGGCAAEDGFVVLRTDKDKLLHGEFLATGTTTTGSLRCELAGTLEKVPIER